jgi:hypothetical protein
MESQLLPRCGIDGGVPLRPSSLTWVGMDCGETLKNPLQIRGKTGFVHRSGRQAHASTGGSRRRGASAVSLNAEDSERSFRQVREGAEF